MANTIPPPLPPPPPRLPLSMNPAAPAPPPAPVAVAAPAPAALALAAAAKAELKKPYITIKKLTTVVDASIGRHVDDLDERIALKELPVIGPSGTSKSTAAPKFERTQGDHPDLKVDIYEQMVYHRAKSTNKNLLEIFVPTRYKINYDKIKQYFATKGADKDVDDLKKTVISAYGNNYNSLFYKHTIAGKTAPAAAAAARTGSSGGDLDKLAMESIQDKIDRWHFNYAEWSFYDNASSFFVQKTMLPKDELLTLKMDFDDVFGGAGAGGLITIVDEISRNYTGLKAKYKENIDAPVIVTPSSTLDNYNKLFKILYAEIDKRKTDPLDYVTERQRDFPSYTFDVNTMNYLLRAFERLYNISQEMTTVPFGATPINSKIKLLETLNDEYTQLIQGIERDANLKNANDIFTKYMLGPNKKYDGKFIPNYKIIQYIFWLINGGVVAGNDTFVNDAFTVDYAAADVNPEDLYGLIKDLPAAAVLTPEDETKKAQFMKDGAMIVKLEDINKLIAYRLGQDVNPPPGIASNHPPEYNVVKLAPWVVTNLKAQKELITRAINIELDELRKQVGIAKFEATKSDDKTAEIKSKIRELKGKHFASMLIFYNYLEAKKDANIADIAEFFNTFYEESKLMNADIDSHSSIVGPTPKTVPTFSFGIDILFWTLLRITKYYSGKHINFIKTMKEKIGPENPDLRNLRLEIGVKESKLKHICELIANTGNISIDAIIPDRAGYYIKDVAGADNRFIGFVNPVTYTTEWRKKIDPAGGGGETANDIIKTTNKMKKKLDESLGTTQGDLTEMLSTLIELNTIQVVNMLFARPRNIWYSPDLRIKPYPDESSKWILFQLDKTKIISGRAFSKFQKELKAPVDDAVGAGGVGVVGVSRLRRILDKKSTKPVPPIIFTALDQAEATPFLIFIIATQPFPPRMLDKDNLKDAADVMFDDPSFAPAADAAAGVAAGAAAGAAGGIIENGSDMKGAMANTIAKIKGKILPTKESCATSKDAISNAATDLNDSFNKTLRSIGVDLERKVDKFLQKPPPPPPPPSMIPPPLPPPPPSAAALATHQAGQQAAAAAAAQQAAAAAALAVAKQEINALRTIMRGLLGEINIWRAQQVFTQPVLNTLHGFANTSAQLAETESARATAAAAAAHTAAQLAQLVPSLQRDLQAANLELTRTSTVLNSMNQELKYLHYNLRHEEIKLELTTPPPDFVALLAKAQALELELRTFNVSSVRIGQQLQALKIDVPNTIQQIVTAQQAAAAAQQAAAQQAAAQQAAAQQAAAAAAALAAQQAADQAVVDAAQQVLAASRVQIKQSASIITKADASTTNAELLQLLQETYDSAAEAERHAAAAAATQSRDAATAAAAAAVDPTLRLQLQKLARDLNSVSAELTRQQQQLLQLRDTTIPDRIEQIRNAAASELVLLRQILDCINEIFTRLKIQNQLPAAPVAAGITSAILRAHIVNWLDILVNTNARTIVDNLLNEEGIPREVQDRITRLEGLLGEITDLSNCNTTAFQSQQQALIADINERIGSLGGAITDRIIPSDIVILTRLYQTIQQHLGKLQGSNPITQTFADNVCELLRNSTDRFVSPDYKNYILAHLDEIMGDTGDRCDALKLEHAKCIDDQNARLAEANLYLQQLKGTFKSQALQPPLPDIAGSQSGPAAGAIEQSISQHLDALIEYLNAGVVFNPTNDELKALNAGFVKDMRVTLTESLPDTKLDECTDPNITGPIKAKIEEYLDIAKKPINIPDVTQSLQPNITAIRTGLEGELANIKAQPVDYTLPKSSTNFIQNVADIRASASPLLHDAFTQQTTPLRAEIAKFVTDSLAAINTCHREQLSAAAAKAEEDRVAAERDASLREYFQVLNGIPGMPVPLDSSSMKPEARISSRLPVLLNMVTETMKNKTDKLRGQQNKLTDLITETDAKLTELRKFAAERLVMCNEQATLAANTPKLEGIVAGLGVLLSQLRTAQAENTSKLAGLENDASEIRKNIKAENVTSQFSNPILNVASIQGIRDEYIRMTGEFDAATAALANSISSSRSELARYTRDAATVTREIEACIERRKTAADAMVAEATRLEAELTRKEAECKQRIAALETIANAETENPDLKLRIAALKVAHSTFKGQLQAIETSHVPNTNVLGYQTGLAGAGAGELNALSKLATDSIKTLTKQNHDLDEMLDELPTFEGKTADIQKEIESDKAEADARKAEEERVAAAASDKAAEDKAVVELADMESVSIYLPTPVPKRQQAPQAGKQSDSSSQSDPLELEEVEPETILEFVVKRPAGPGAAAAGSLGGSIRHRGKRHVLQRGGLGEGGPIVLRVTRLTPEVRTLLLNFNPLNLVLTPELFREIIKDVTPMSREDAEAEYKKISGALISSSNTGRYFDILGQKVAWKTSIMKLMIFLDLNNVRTSQSGLSYSVMYDKLWTFMERDSGSIAKLREIFRDKKIGDKTLESVLLGSGKLGDILERVGWLAPTKNTLFDNLFKVFSDCKIITGVKPTESTFLTERTSTKANNMYRFKLNWLILIAFHIYHTAKPENQRQLLTHICEFVENLYNIFVGWMIDMDAKSLDGEFMPKTTTGQTYIMKTSALITTESTDGSLTLLREAIRDKLCEFGPIKERISAAKAAKEAAVAAKSQASSAASSRSSSPAPAPAQASSRSASPESRPISSGNTKPPVMKAIGLQPQPPPTTSPLIRRIKGSGQHIQAGQEAVDVEAVAEEARKRFAAEDAAAAKEAKEAAAKEAAAARLSRGNTVEAKDKWKKDPFMYKQDHPGYEELAAVAAAAKQKKQTEHASRFVPVGPSDEFIALSKSAAVKRQATKPTSARRGGNKQRTRKRHRVASTHHHTKRRILRNKNHKHTRKARQVRASVSV